MSRSPSSFDASSGSSFPNISWVSLSMRGKSSSGSPRSARMMYSG